MGVLFLILIGASDPRQKDASRNWTNLVAFDCRPRSVLVLVQNAKERRIVCLLSCGVLLRLDATPTLTCTDIRSERASRKRTNFAARD